MTTKLTFKEYCMSKETLRLAADTIPQIMEEYELVKYCKFPIVADEEDKQYLSFKPKDRISVLWEYLSPETPCVKKVLITTDEEIGARIQPAWSNTKLSSWLAKNTTVKAK